MNMPAPSLAQPAAAAAVVPPVDTGPRRLADDVFQSAEEAVLVEGQGNAFVDAAAPAGPAPDSVGQAGHRRFSLTNAVRAHVAARPCQSALLAAAVGAMAMWALRSQLGGRLPPLRSPWLRRTEAGRPRR